MGWGGKGGGRSREMGEVVRGSLHSKNVFPSGWEGQLGGLRFACHAIACTAALQYACHAIAYTAALQYACHAVVCTAVLHYACHAIACSAVLQ